MIQIGVRTKTLFSKIAVKCKFINKMKSYASHGLRLFAAVTCMYEEVLVKKDYNIEPNFTIQFANGTMETRSKLKPVPYPYMTTIRYLCKEGYETVTKKPDQNISCGSIGRWRPQIYGCIGERTA